jgi:isopenicillin N synthase-like dioxygenase
MDSKIVHEEPEVPVIDLAPLLDPTKSSEVRTAELTIIGQIGKACEEWGFFQVINHGIPAELIEEVLNISRIFFQYHAQEKMKVRAKAQRGDQPQLPTGYNAYPPCRWDSYENLYYLAGPAACNAFPEDLPQLRSVVEKLMRFLSQTAELMESLISQSLRLPANFLKEFIGDRIEPFKLLCYRKARSQEEEIGAREHQDSSCITLVGQDESGGYQVLKDGKWVDIKPIKGALVINIGDILQVWSNNRFRSAVHRVVNSKERRRCSFAYGRIPNPDMIVKPFAQFTTGMNCPAAYTAFLYRDYMLKKIHDKTHPPTAPEDFVNISIYAIHKMNLESNTM